MRPIEQSIGTAVPIAYAATLAMAAFQGEDVPCVTLGSLCTNPPCGGLALLEVSERCPFPIASEAKGTIAVTGSRITEDTGVFSATFGDIDVGGKRLVFKTVELFVVTEFSEDLFTEHPGVEEGFKVVYLDVDVVANDDMASLEESGWVIDVATRGTPGDPSDDLMLINGVRQWAGVGSDPTGAAQTGLTMVVMDARCPLNPVSGYGLMQAVTTDIQLLGDTFLYFHEECDGKARILFSLGATTPSTSTLVELNLLSDGEFG